MDNDERADRLAEIAAQLVGRVRDDDPDAVDRWLRSVVNEWDWPAFAVVLACAVPVDVPWLQLTAWARIRAAGTGGPDTPEAIARRRRDLDEALNGRRAS